MDHDVYYHKTIDHRVYGHNLRFMTSQELFSSHDIDIGTRFLLRSIVEAGLDKSLRILDLGCGYGPLGICLKKLNSESDMHMVDRDALAVLYSRFNAEINGLDGMDIYGSLGYDDVSDTGFNLIVSNVPGKAGKSVISHLIREAVHYLTEDGIVAVVVVNPLEGIVSDILRDTSGIDIIRKHTRAGHTVFHYCFTDEARATRPDGDSVERGIYHREDIVMRLAGLEYTLQTAYGLPEFDSLDYRTELLIKSLQDISLSSNIRYTAVFNPGQGHAAMALWKMAQPEKLHLVDRDLLALRYSHRNLLLNSCPTERIMILHGMGFDFESKDELDLIVGVLRDEEGREAVFQTIRQAAEKLSPQGRIVIAAGSTIITRLLIDLKSQHILSVVKREKRKGCGCLVLERI